MEFVTSTTQRASVGRGVREAPVLSMYATATNFQKMSLDQFAQLGWERVRVLQKFEEVACKGDELVEVEQTAALRAAERCLRVSKAQRAVKSQQHFDAAQLVLDNTSKDCLSHFVLRLAYCWSADLRNWLLAQEVALFKWRFLNRLEKAEQAAFVRACGELGEAHCEVSD
jgi:DNA primase large subunit